ncbi:MAG: AmpG family muropeptide MFS transporter [Gammaproteobacteria bacterium]|nr:AmpG family muropeptide MFS transporter [Gammaproteobacteria bacterium]
MSYLEVISNIMNLRGLMMRFFSISLLPLSQIILFFLGGLSNGLPGVLTWQTMNIWLANEGHSKSLIGLIFLAGIPYNLKILLSWSIDRIELPVLTRYFGHRRAWAISLQALIACCLVLLGWTTGHASLPFTGILCFITSLLSAMNQVATVSHRIEQVSPEKTGQSVAVGIVGYRCGKFIGRAGAIILLSICSWPTIYTFFALLMSITMIAYCLIPDRIAFDLEDRKIKTSPSSFPEESHSLPQVWKEMFLEPFLTFKEHNPRTWIPILLILSSLNLGDALTLGMCDLFYFEQGYSSLIIASITKGLSLFCIIIGGLLAAYYSSERQHVFRLLILSAYMHLASHILFIILASMPPSSIWLTVTIILESFSAGMRATLIATWVAQLCRHYGLTGRQYAFFSSLKAIPFFIIASLSGVLADSVSWPYFFLCSLCCALPSIIILVRTADRFMTTEPQNNPYMQSALEPSLVRD